MFIDNGDGTYTVRFFAGALGMFYSGSTISGGFLSGSGVADYITVNRQLPTYSNGTLAYSGAGSLASSSSTTLWIPLLEKAYAQWNETGNAGRNGTNTYAGIEGGWMHNVNAPVLGFNSTNYLMSSAQKSALVNSINSGLAVTIGTNSSASAGGLVGSHAYIVTGYDSGTDTFTLFNPWGFAHPSALSWAQLQSNCSMIVVTNTAGTSPISSSALPGLAALKEGTTEMIVGGWFDSSTIFNDEPIQLEVENDQVVSFGDHSDAGNQLNDTDSDSQDNYFASDSFFSEDAEVHARLFATFDLLDEALADSDLYEAIAPFA